MDTTTAQAIVAQAVVDRGYRNGWTAEQFAARQVAKMVEELGEMARDFVSESDAPFDSMGWLVEGYRARYLFDNSSWNDAQIYSPAAAYSELCDVVVVALTMADVLSEIIGKPLDVVVDAVAKATADVKRGVR